MEHNEMNIHQMRTYMVGREISDNYYRIDYDGSYDNTVVFKGTNITSGPVLENFSFELHKGEILGIGGLSECGMHDLGRAIFGADRLITGSIYINGEKFVANPRRAIQNKIGYVSKNRDEEAVVLNDTIGNNIVLPSIPMLEKIFHISRKSERKLSVEMVNVMSIKCESIDQLVNQLSGGNKQKVVFAKWLGNNSDILILDCPTRGIDVGVKVAMYKLMYELKEQGKSIIMISEELPELIGMSDRLIILREGKISKQFTRNKSLSEVDIIQYMI
jgi:ribose transport system ATP-binding protein